MADMSLEEIEDLATWAEGLSKDTPADMGFQIEARDLGRFASAIRQLLDAQKWREIAEFNPTGNWNKWAWVWREGFSPEPVRWSEYLSGNDYTEGWLDSYYDPIDFAPTHFLNLPLPPLKDQGEQEA